MNNSYTNSSETATTFFDFAERNGLALAPLLPNSKDPFPEAEHHPTRYHSRNRADWETWLSNGCNFALPAKPNSLILFDVDPRNGGNESWQKWIGQHGHFEPAWLTRSRGHHVLFRAPPGEELSGRKPKEFPGIDIICNIYVVCPPSVVDGKRYSRPFAGDPTIHECDALVEMCRKTVVADAVPSPESNRELAELVARLPANVTEKLNEDPPQGERSEAIAAAIAALIRSECSDDEIVTLLLAHPVGGKYEGNARRAHSDVVRLRGKGFGAQPSAQQMFGRAEIQAKYLTPILDAVPRVERTSAHPELPDIGHPLRDAINAAIPGIMATGDPDALAAVAVVHPITAAAIGAVTPTVEARAEQLSANVEQELRSGTFSRDRSGKPEGDNPHNVRVFLAGLGIDIRWNAWTERIELKGWRWSHWTELSDGVAAILMTHAAETVRLVMGVDFTWRTLRALADENTQDPARDLLDELQAGWDGASRIDTWLCQACGVPDDVYHRAVSRLVLLGLVGRIRQPGVKFDTMLVFVSPTQGTAKSTLAKVLALNEDWFTDGVKLGEEAKELVLSLAGKSVVEISEMRSRGEIEGVKAMLSRTRDEARAAFGRAITRRPRRNIFIGSTNRPEFLEDDTGNRRFLPVTVVGETDIEWVQANIAQLIGEAATLQTGGESLALPRDVWEIAGEYQEAARIKSDMEIQLHDWFGGDAAGYITSADLAELARIAGWPKNNAVRSATMSKLGFRDDRIYVNGKRTRAWVRGNRNDAPQYLIGSNGTGRPRVALLLGNTALPPPSPPPR